MFNFTARTLRLFLATLLLLATTAAIGDDASTSVQIQSDVVYGHKDGLAMTVDIYQPTDNPNGAGLLFIVSGGWYSRWAPAERSLPFYAPFLDAGYTVFAVRHGSSPRYGIPDAISDVTRAVRFVRSTAADYAIDPDRLGAMGNSAGGHLALVLGTQGDDGLTSGDALAKVSSRVAAVVALVPPTDLTIAVWEAPESLPAYRRFPALELAMDKAEAASPVFDASPDDAPSLLIMGGADELVPLTHGERMAEAFEREDVAHKLVVIEGAGHDLGGEVNLPEVMRESVEWLDLHLNPPPTQLNADR